MGRSDRKCQRFLLNRWVSLTVVGLVDKLNLGAIDQSNGWVPKKDHERRIQDTGDWVDDEHVAESNHVDNEATDTRTLVKGERKY